jgi:hypothetical protein
MVVTDVVVVDKVVENAINQSFIKERQISMRKKRANTYVVQRQAKD